MKVNGFIDKRLNGTSTIIRKTAYDLSRISLNSFSETKTKNFDRFNHTAEGIWSMMRVAWMSSIEIETQVKEVNLITIEFKAILNTIQSSCKIDIDDDINNIHDIVDTTLLPIASGLSQMIESYRNDSESIIPELENQTRYQLDLDVGESKIESHLGTLKQMLAYFQENVNKSAIVRQEVKERVKISYTRPTTLMLFLYITLGIVIFLSSFAFWDIYIIFHKYIGQKIWFKLVTFLFFFTILLTIITASVIVAMLFGILASFDCPSKSDNFGVSDFILPFIENNSSTTENKSYPICATRDTSFFSILGDEKLVTNTSITQILQFDGPTREQELDIWTQPKLLKPFDFTNVTKSIQITKRILDKLVKLHETSCLNAQQKEYFSKNRVEFQKLVDNFTIFENDIIREFNLMNARSVIGSIVDEKNSIFVNTIVEDYERIKKDINISDFQCNPVIEEFRQIGQDICEEVEIPIEDSWVLLPLTMILCVACLVVHILTYRCEMKENKDDESEIIETAHSPLFKSDGQIVKTPA